MDALTLFPKEIEELASQVLEAAKARGVMIATAESCTGGLISGALTEISGSSSVVDRGFVTYSYGAKEALLGVDHDVLHAHGAVSEAVARMMAEGALARSAARLAVAVTGVAGPGASENKPAGLVWFGIAGLGATLTLERRFEGGRSAVRLATVREALDLLLERLAGQAGLPPAGPAG